MAGCLSKADRRVASWLSSTSSPLTEACMVHPMDDAAVSLSRWPRALACRAASHARRRCVRLAAKHPNDQDDDHDENDGSEADIH
jgi:hypothetical protein